ncbi:ribonuclease E [Kushneria pakistanensis]|uniref:Ribonuclease E n=1 Tax=Kushneria pakistanensis TaxID=1508770 RepID=A0ABQ3FDM9_9GAMM|nr:ribonuclease E [Kushneria pakistanensis]GHC19193.1 ribonuclease E [Kushneria pakistanensis]
MKRMLINATQPEELRVALVDGQRLYDLDIESGAREQKKANIYRGRITRVEPSLEAAFVDFGADRHGFLPLKEISREYFSKEPSGNGRPNIREVIKEGQEVIVQVDKEERGNKGAALTTFISLAGRFLVLMPNNPRAGGISRRIEGDERTELKEAMSQLNMPEKMGVIVRTAGIGRSSEELQWDLDYLVQVWETITEEAGKRSAPFLIYRESNVIIRAMRDYLRQDIGEVLIDHTDVHEEAINFVKQVMPSYQQKIKLYNDDVPLFSRFQIESQIETAYEREVKLPSGGSVVIDHTEALVSIDINSSRATKGGDIEETALQTNLEAADEIARQLRLRDIGGLVVIDFIDMTPSRNQREVENRVRDALKLDRARVQIGRISRFGLMEMSRQRLRPSLGETSGVVCPRCNGQGTIRDVRSLSLSIMRLIEEEAMKDRSSQIRAMLPVPVATYLLNEKRNVLADIERRQGVRVMLLPQPELETPHYDVQRYRDDQVDPEEAARSSFELSDDFEAPEDESETYRKPVKRTEAAVRSVAHRTPAPEPVAPQVNEEPSGFLSRLMKGFNRLMGSEESSSKQETASAQPKKENTRPAVEEEKQQPSAQESTAREEQKSSSSNGEQRNNRRDNARRDDSAGGKNGRNDKRLSSDKSRDDKGRRERPSRDSDKSDKNDNATGRNDKRQQNNAADKGDNTSADRNDKRQQNGASSKSDNSDKRQQAAPAGKSSERTRDEGERKKPSADAPAKAESAKSEHAQSSPAQDGNDGQPQRTRNNPRQRSRKQALSPEAVAEQERLQAEAHQSRGTADTDTAKKGDGSKTESPTSASSNTADSTSETLASTHSEASSVDSEKASASEEKAPATSGNGRKSVSATFGRESQPSEAVAGQQSEKTDGANETAKPAAVSPESSDKRQEKPSSQKASQKSAATTDDKVAGAEVPNAASGKATVAGGDTGSEGGKRSVTDTSVASGSVETPQKSDTATNDSNERAVADSASSQKQEGADAEKKTSAAAMASEAAPREQPQLISQEAEKPVTDRASREAPARDINKQSVTAREKGTDKAASKASASPEASQASEQTAPAATANAADKPAGTDAGKPVSEVAPKPASHKTAPAVSTSDKSVTTAEKSAGQVTTAESASTKDASTSENAPVSQQRQRRRAHNDPRERRRQQQREQRENQSSGE